MSDPRARLQQHILEQSPRLGPDDTFCFDCHPGISCFNHCCADVNIFLSPYDVLRMKRRLGMTSSQFLDTYTILPVHKDMKTPAVVLKMDAGTKRCPFLTDEGCGIYSDRPWPCRMYPLGLASQKDTPDGWRGDLAVLLGLVPADDARTLAAAARLARGTFALLREQAPGIDPRPELTRALADGTLERHLGFG